MAFSRRIPIFQGPRAGLDSSRSRHYAFQDNGVAGKDAALCSNAPFSGGLNDSRGCTHAGHSLKPMSALDVVSDGRSARPPGVAGEGGGARERLLASVQQAKQSLSGGGVGRHGEARTNSCGYLSPIRHHPTSSM